MYVEDISCSNWNFSNYYTGDVDPVVKYQFGMMTSTVLKQYYTDVTFNTYKNMVHSSSPKVCFEQQTWMFLQFVFIC